MTLTGQKQSNSMTGVKNNARPWKTIKFLAGLATIFCLLFAVGGTVISQMAAFRQFATREQPVPVNEVASSIGASVQLGAWFVPLGIGFVIVWFVARAKLRSHERQSVSSRVHPG